MASGREPFAGRFYGVFNVEGDDPSPLFVFRSRDDAALELARRQALPEEHDDRLDEYCQLFPVDLIGAWWNSYDPDPRNGLDPSEVIAAYNGDEGR